MSSYRPFSNAARINLEQFKRNINAAGIYDRSDIQWFDKFNRMGAIDPYNVVTQTKEYLFFTKPDLHIFKSESASSGLNPEIKNYPFFDDMYKNYKRVLSELQLSATNNDVFIKVLSNSVKNTLDLPTVSANTTDTSSTIYGVKQTYRGGSYSDEAIDFSLEFEDTKFLDLYMFFKCWDEYEKKKALGLVTPPDDDYIINKILHDQIAIYKFIVGEDGESIIYYAKMYGCFPTGVPREAFSDMNRNGGLIYSVPWRAFSVEDMDPLILRDFNTLSSGMISGRHDLPLYNLSTQSPDPTWANAAYVYAEPSGSYDPRKYTYKLRWRR